MNPARTLASFLNATDLVLDQLLEELPTIEKWQRTTQFEFGYHSTTYSTRFHDAQLTLACHESLEEDNDGYHELTLTGSGRDHVIDGTAYQQRLEHAYIALEQRIEANLQQYSVC